MKRNFLKISAIAILLLIVTISCNKDANVDKVTLDKGNITLSIGETAILTATVYPEDAANKTVSWTSSNTDVAIVTNGTVTAKEIGSTTIIVITEDGNYTAKCVVTVTSAKWVEINGIKWAKFNVNMPGTFAANPEDAGMFYQWNRKVGWSSTDPMINSNGGTTWDTTGAEGTIWEKANDPCPVGWRVPTFSELESLIDAASQWTTVNDVTGRIFGSDTQTLFLPASGHRCIALVGGLHYVDTTGYYWSSSIDYSNGAYNLGFTNISVSIGDHEGNGSGRSAGFSVRCVAE